MEIKYDYWTGSYNDVVESLSRSVAQYLRHYRKVRIGITNNPERRKIQYERGNKRWDYLIVKYQTSSINFINRLEKELIDNNYDCIENEIGGGGGPKGKGKQYLYVLLKR